MIREIVTYPDKRLKLKSSDIVSFDEKLQTLLDDMYETMRSRDGVGLAAIQIGVPKNVLIINPVNENGEQDRADLIEMVNPVVISKQGETFYQEGCLSIPGFYEEVKRFEIIQVKYFDRFGVEKLESFDGFLAIAFQHEFDHLNGQLFVERLSILRRKKFEKEWKKKQKEQ